MRSGVTLAWLSAIKETTWLANCGRNPQYYTTVYLCGQRNFASAGGPAIFRNEQVSHALVTLSPQFLRGSYRVRPTGTSALRRSMDITYLLSAKWCVMVRERGEMGTSRELEFEFRANG